jgi:hypothetical protein
MPQGETLHSEFKDPACLNISREMKIGRSDRKDAPKRAIDSQESQACEMNWIMASRLAERHAERVLWKAGADAY